MPTFYCLIECSPLSLEVVLYSLKNRPYVRLSPRDEQESHYFVFEAQRDRDVVRSFARHNQYLYKELTDVDMIGKHFDETSFAIAGDRALVPGLAV